MKKCIFYSIVLIIYSSLIHSFPFNNKIIKEELVTFEYPIIPGASLKIVNLQGKIKIEGWNQEKVFVKTHKKAPENKLPIISIAKDFTKQKSFIKSTVKQGSAAYYRFPLALLYGKSPSPKDVEVDYYIKVPFKTPLLVKSAGGEIIIKNMHNLVAIKTSKSSITTTAIVGALNILTQEGNITVMSSKGPITIQTYKSDIEVRNASSAVTINLVQGDVTTSSIAGPINIKSEKGDIIVDQAQEAVTIALKMGSIGLKDIKGPLDASTGQGDIDIENAQNSSIIKTDNGSITFIKKDKNKKQSAQLSAKIN